MAYRNIRTSSSVLSKYGIENPFIKRGLGTDEDETELSKIQGSIANYQTRIGNAGAEVPEPEKKTNLFLKALELWDKPTRAVMNTIGGVVNQDQEDGLLQNLKKGWTGEEEYQGRDLMVDLFGEADTKIGKAAQGIGGFVTEAVVDPTNLLTLGAGSLAKGFLTGTAKGLTEEAAEKISKGLLKNALVGSTDDVVQQALKSALPNAATNPNIVDDIVRQITHQNANDVLSKYGRTLTVGNNAYTSDIMKDATRTLADALRTGDKAMSGKGLSVAGKTIGGLSNSRLQDLGASASDFVKNKGGIVGTGLEKVQNKLNSLFDPSYIEGMDASGRQVVNFFKKDVLGSKNLADSKLLDKTKGFSDSLGKLGVKTGREQDELIIKYIEGIIPADQLDVVTRKIADEIKGDLKAWGLEEMDAKTLTNMMNGYFPHTTNWKYYETYKGRTQLGGINKKLGVTNTSAFKRKFGNIEEGNFIMKFRTSTTEAQDDFIDYLVRQSDPDSVQKFADAINTTATPHDAMFNLSAFKNGDWKQYADLDGVDDFFETSAVKSYISRGLKHNKVIADKDFLDSVKAAFGQPVVGAKGVMEARRQGLDVIIDRQSVNMFMASTNEGRAMAQAARMANGNAQKVGNINFTQAPQNVQAVLERITQDGAPAFTKVTNEEYMLLASVYPVEAYAMSRGAVEAINKYAGRQIETGLSAIGDLVDWMHSKWKPTVTGLRPDYHIRNLFGSSEQNVRDLGLKALDPELNLKATKIAQGAKTGTVDLAGQRFTYGEIRDQMIRTNASSGFMRTDPVSLSGELSSKIIEDLSPRKGAFAKLNKLGREVGNRVEDEVRTVNFIANIELALEKGLTKEQAFKYAGEMVSKYHFDYTDLTKFEKDVVKRVMPFYTFFKKNFGLQMEEFFNSPTFYNELPRFNRNMNAAFGVDDSDAPEWFAEANPISVPFLQTEEQKEAGSTPYLNLSMPSSSISEYTDPLGTLVGMLSPVIKTPIELQTGARLFNNSPIERYPGEKTEVLPGVEMNAKLAHVLNQFGVLRDVSRVASAGDGTTSSSVTPFDDSAVSAIFNTLRAYNPEKAEVEQAYDYQRQLGNEVQKLKDTGTTVLDVDDIEFIQDNFPEYMDVVRQLGFIPEILRSKARANQKMESKRGTLKEQTVKFR